MGLHPHRFKKSSQCRVQIVKRSTEAESIDYTGLNVESFDIGKELPVSGMPEHLQVCVCLPHIRLLRSFLLQRLFAKK